MEIFRGKTYDAEAYRMYPIKGVNNYEGTSEFIKKMIRLIDGQGKDNKKDGKIQNEELQACYNKPELYHTFSRMVCKHKSEWSYKWEKIEEDGKKFLKYHHPDASDDKIKERLKETKTKYDALYDFWDKLNFKTDVFWYFEPFGWVEQMKRVFGGKWHYPVDNPMCTIFTQSQVSGEFNENGKHWGLFGKTRDGSTHQGLDLFAIPSDNVYACVDGIIYEKKRHEGYGQTVTIKITDKETFLLKKREYQLLFPNEGEIEQGDYYNENDDIFLFYAHLDEILVEKNDNVRAGDIIAKAGVSGVKTGTCAPHLHFEIFSTLYAVGKGLKYRINPAFFIDFKNFNTMNEEERKLQQNTAKAGKILNLEGKGKL